MRGLFLFLVLPLLGCRKSIHIDQQGLTILPGGVGEVTTPIRISAVAHDLEVGGDPAGTTLRAAPGFKGEAVLVIQGARHIKLTGFAIDGNRSALAKPVELPPSNISFARFYPSNGILAANVEGLTIEKIQLTDVANYSILVSTSSQVHIQKVSVR